MRLHRRGKADRGTIGPDLSGVGLDLAAQSLDQIRFSGAIVADDGEDFPRHQIEIGLIQSGGLAIALDQTARAQNGFGAHCDTFLIHWPIATATMISQPMAKTCQSTSTLASRNALYENTLVLGGLLLALLLDQPFWGHVMVPHLARAVTARRKALVTVLAWTIGLALFFPILWTVILSFKTEGDAITPDLVDGEHCNGVDAFFAEYEQKPLGQKKKEVGASVPFGRMGTAEDLTGMAIFLATRAADDIAAQTHDVDGGNWMS